METKLIGQPPVLQLATQETPTKSESQVGSYVARVPGPNGQSYPMVYPSQVPFVIDPALNRKKEQSSISSKTVPVILPERPVLTDRGCSPIIFPEPSPAMVSTATETDSPDKPEMCCVSVQTCSVDVEQMPQKHTVTEQSCQTSDTEMEYRHSGGLEALYDLATPILSKMEDLRSPNSMDAYDRSSCSPQPPKLIAEGDNYINKDDISVIDNEVQSKTFTKHTATSDSVSKSVLNDLSYLEPEISQASDGLELLSVLAEHAQKQVQQEQQKREPPLKGNCYVGTEPEESSQESEYDDMPDINRNYNVPKSYMLIDLPEHRKWCTLGSPTRSLPTTPRRDSTEQYSPVFKINTGKIWLIIY